ncbi:alpha/beta-hydrolase [Thozetella sp. PMI_491]|nr:alpha/beta-hydrolase [Thozetella sp. PMI_491]
MGNSISYNTTECQVTLGGKAGVIKGLQCDSKSRRFAGVPYAQQPVGDLRWRKPQPLPSDYVYSMPGEGPYDATSFGSVCPQASYSEAVKKHTPKHNFGEDCLRLNIWTPVPDPQQLAPPKWPVVIWFHGGWFQVGDPSQEESMDPTELISTGKLQAVFIAVGYRLNVFGFLAGSALQDESGGTANGNYGLWDQRLAMDWIYQNVEAFGGDPGIIVLAGRSAGAYSVLAQALHDFRTEQPKNHFRRLLMISNAIPTQPKSTEECETQFDELCQLFGISTSLNGSEKLRLLRQVSAEDLSSGVMKLNHHTFRPVTDNLFIHAGIFSYYRDGSFAREFQARNLRLFIGEVANEDTLYAVTNGPEANFESMQLQINNYYPASTTARLLDHYGTPASELRSDWQRLFGQIIADGQVRAPSRYLVNNLLQNGISPDRVWRYLINYRLSFITEEVAPASFGVSHGMDRPIWNYSITHGPTPAEIQLLDEWMRDLKGFVHGDVGYSYGTLEVDEFKVMTQDGMIEVQKDLRWEELLQAISLFSGEN